METITKKEFKDLPDTTTPLKSEWLNEFQDKIIANFNEIVTNLQTINTKLEKVLTYTVVNETTQTTNNE